METALANTQPILQHRTAAGTVRLLELIRFTIRAPAVDLLDDCPLAINVAEKLWRAVAARPELEAPANSLVLKLEELLAETQELQFDFERDNEAAPPNFLIWSNNLFELQDIESAVQELQDEINYIRQKRRSEETFAERNEIYSTVADFAERKSAIILSELEEEEGNVGLLASQGEKLSFTTRGFVSAMAAISGKVIDEVEEDDKGFLRATQRLTLAVKRAKAASAPDDLKRIRGIGILIERKLNALGTFSYEEIANWTEKDIERISQLLDFKGRIQRESWVEQARILAAGGDTEFSRRLDRRDSDGRPKS